MTHWWQKGIVYQIYPRSFQDTNGDGIDGFRVDVVYRAMKDPDLPDNPINPNWQEGMDPNDTFTPIYPFKQPR